jgi:DNA-binding CsgD family transcriptional regulator
VFEDLSSKRMLSVELTPREREVAALLIQGLTSKLVGRRLDISPRTVDVYRARLMRKVGAATRGQRLLIKNSKTEAGCLAKKGRSSAKAFKSRRMLGSPV